MKHAKGSAVQYPMKISTSFLLRLIRDEQREHPERKFTTCLRGKWTFEDAVREMKKLIKDGVKFI